MTGEPSSRQGGHERPDVALWLQPERLWSERVRAFWGGLLPYMKYVISSGLGTLLIFGFVAGTALYASFVEKIPPAFPVRELAFLLLTPSAAYMTYRTYLVPADIALLLRIEHRMKPYFIRSARASFIPRFILLLAVWCVLWPLYYRADAMPKSFLLTLLFLTLVKGVVAYGAWIERQTADIRWRLAARWLRYGWAALACAAWLWMSAPAAGLLAGIAGIVYLLFMYRFIPKQRLAWEAHIEAERMHVNRIHTFLSGFVDLPASDERRIARPWLNRLGDRFAFRREHAYRYLLTKTFARSELAGILIRFTVIGHLLLWWTRDTVWNLLLLLLILFALGAQCNALFQMHRHDVWRLLYPLPPGSKQRAARQLAAELQMIAAVLLLIPIAFGSIPIEYKLAAAGLTLVVQYGFWLRRKGKRYADGMEEE